VQAQRQPLASAALIDLENQAIGAHQHGSNRVHGGSYSQAHLAVTK
jgi:hypothetical protein